MNYETASTADLERWEKQPRNAEDGRRIREELRRRTEATKDTGTMSLFSKQTSNAERRTSNIE